MIAIGECMLELIRDGDGWRLGYAGDTFNTAVYLNRLGVPTAFMTAQAASRLAARVIQHRGAIVPRDLHDGSIWI